MQFHFYLVRHGQKHVEYGDPPLTTLGRSQAELTGKHFAEQFSVDAVYASPLLRTQQTAQAIAAASQREVALDPRLRERANWDGSTTFEDFLQMWRQASKDRQAKPALGVSSYEAGHRVQWLIHDIVMNQWHQRDVSLQPVTQHIVLVSHGGTITDFLRNIFTDQDLLQKYYKSSENIINTNIPECSITQVNVSLDGKHQGMQEQDLLPSHNFSLGQVAQTVHLEPLYRS